MPARCGRPSPRLAVLAAGVLVVTGAYAYAVPGTAGAAPTSASAVTTVRLPVDVARRLSARHAPSRVVPARGASLLTGQTDDTVAGAWNYTKGLDRTGRPVVVAVVDSGVDMTDPGLRDAMWTNPGEMPRNAIDDDHNGFVDDVHGADLITPGDDTHDPYGHGTEVAGVIAARPDGTDDGVTGIAYQAQIMSVRVLDETGRGNSAARRGHRLRGRQRRRRHQRLRQHAGGRRRPRRGTAVRGRPRRRRGRIRGQRRA